MQDNMKCGLPDHSDRDWEEDFTHENGNYSNKCMECNLYFYGHKRRVICKKCMTPDWVEVAKRKRPEDTKDNKAWAGAWLEGEMVGYAKCMVENVLGKVAPVKSEGEDEETQDSMWMEVCVRCYGIDREGVTKVMKDLIKSFTITRNPL